jgi:hypothetical protein
VAPFKWASEVEAAPVVCPLRDDGTAPEDADAFAVHAAADYDRMTGDGRLSLTLDGVPVQHALGIMARIFRALYPGPFGFSRLTPVPAATAAVAASPHDDALPWSVDRERLAAQLSEATERLTAVDAERDALRVTMASVHAEHDRTEVARVALVAELREARDELTAADARYGYAMAGVLEALGVPEGEPEAAHHAIARVAAIRADLDSARARSAENDTRLAELDRLRDGLADALAETQLSVETAHKAHAATRADLDAARSAHRYSEAARVQLASEFELLRGEVDALRTDAEGWRTRALRAEAGAPTASGGLTVDDVAAAVEEALAPWRSAAEEARNAYGATVEAERVARAEVATLHARLHALGAPPVPASVGMVAAPLAPRAPASEPPPPAPVSATPLVVAPPLMPAGMPSPVAAVVAPQGSQPVVDPWSTEDESSVTVPAVDVVAPPPPAPPVVPPASPAAPARPVGLPPLPPLAGRAPTPSAPAPPTTPPTNSGPEVTPFAAGMGPGSPVTTPVPVSAAPDDLGTGGDLATPEVAAVVGKERFFTGAVQAVLREARARNLAMDFDLLCAEVLGLRAVLAADGRPAVPTFQRFPVEALRDRVAAFVAAQPDCGIELPR